MTQQFILIDRKRYAVGLFWQPVAVGFVPRNYARQLARNIDKKLNMYIEYRAMIGLGYGRKGHRVGTLVAAAEVMETFAEYSSFLAAFKTNAGFWLVGVRNGIILQDKLFETEDEIKKEFIKISSIPDWGALFAPNDWGIPRANERDVKEVLTGKLKINMRPVSHLKYDFIALILFLLFAFGVFYFFKEPIVRVISPVPQISTIDPLLAEEYKKRIDEKDKKLDEKFNIEREKTKLPDLLPYELLPNPVQRAELCYQAIGFLMQPVTGWVQTRAECQDSQAVVYFSRKYGTLINFYEIATELMPGVLVEEVSSSELMVTAKLPDLIAEASLEEKDPETIVREINTLFQQIDSSVDVNITIDAAKLGEEMLNLTVVEVAAKSKLVPMQFMKIFEYFGGVYMTLTAWDAKSKTWNYEVIIYAK